MMDRERKKRLRGIKVLISEAIMVIAVVAAVTVLAFIVSGYWINSNFEVERQGMLQVSSIPTGADVVIDGESAWLQRTNLSKTLTTGEHTVTITKDGYDSWSKTVDISEGLLYRLYYPRLFLKERSAEEVYKTRDYTFATVSPDQKTLILANNTTEWDIVKLNDDKLKSEKLDIAEVFPGVSLAEDAKVGLFTGEIIDTDWSADNRHVIFKLNMDGNTEWVLLDIENMKNSVNLSKEFGANFEAIEMINDAASNLLAVLDGNLRKIDVGAKQMSAILVSDVMNFDYYDNEIVFVAKDKEDSLDYFAGFLKIGDTEIKKISDLDSPAKIVISKFYDEKYITILEENKVSLYKYEKDNWDNVNVASSELSFVPEEIKVGFQGGFIAMSAGQNIATLDMEIMKVIEWSVEGKDFGWLDSSMVYTVLDGELIVYDFDGLNRRVIAKNVSSHFPVIITDNKWLYYFSDDNLVREWLIPR